MNRINVSSKGASNIPNVTAKKNRWLAEESGLIYDDLEQVPWWLKRKVVRRQRWLLLDGTAPVKVVLTIMSASKASQLLYGG